MSQGNFAHVANRQELREALELKSRKPTAPVDVTPTTRLRLAIAAGLAFPNGGVTARDLRLEAAQGRLVIIRIGNKEFTTLAAIDEMCAACRVPSNAEAGISTRASSRGCASPHAAVQAAYAAVDARLKERLEAARKKSWRRPKGV